MSMAFQFDESMPKFEDPAKRLTHEIIDDVVGRLPEDLAVYDKRYRKMASIPIGIRAMALVQSIQEPKTYADIGYAYDERVAENPTVQKLEQQSVTTKLVGETAQKYVRLLRSANRYERAKFRLEDGRHVKVQEYLSSVWVPKYVEEIMTAHELGLAKESVDAIETEAM